MLVFRPGSSGLLLFTFLFLALQSAFSQPANDQCSNPIVIDSSNYTNSQSNAGATAAGDPPPSCNSGQGSGVWYQFTPPTNGVIIVDTSDSDFDTVLAVFTGSCGSLTEIACDDDSFDITSRTASLVSAGVPYLILAGGLDGATGSMVLHLNFTANMLSNDLCSGAIVISGTNYSNSQFTALATSTGDPPPSCPDSPGNGVWYQYTPSTNGLIVVDTAGSDFDTVLAVYTGSCGSLVEVGCNDDANGLVSTSLLTNVVAAGTTYYILAGGWGGQYGNMNFHLNFALGPPENDQCSNAILIAGTSYTHTQSTERATSLNDPASCSAISNGVWYRYTPAANGAIVVDTAGSDFDTVLAVYTGSCGAFTQVGCNDNVGNSTSRVSILGGAGTNYYILAGGFNGATGTLVLNLNFTAGTLPNDQCAGAIVISSPTYTNTQSTVTATSTGDPSVTCVGNFGSGVWYQYTPPLGGTMVVDTVGSSFDTVLAVFTNACGSLTEVGCNDQAGGQSTSQLTNVVTANTAYHILAGGWGSQAGTLVLHLSFVEGPPANDQCAGAIVITNSPYSNTQSTFKATSTNDPTPDCTPLGKGVWYQYTPNVTGAMVVDTAGSDFDTALAVYAGDCNNLTQVGCNDNSGNVTSRASIQAAAGTNYFILAGGFNSATGALTLQLSFTPGTLANDQCSGAIIASGNSYTNTQSTLTATTTGDQARSVAW